MTYISGIRFNQYTPSFRGKSDDDDEVEKKISKKINSDAALALAQKNSDKLLSGPNIMAGCALVLGLAGLILGGYSANKFRTSKVLKDAEKILGKDEAEFATKVRKAATEVPKETPVNTGGGNPAAGNGNSSSGGNTGYA